MLKPAMTGQRAFREWIAHYGWVLIGLPLLVYTLVMLIVTWPLVLNLSGYVAGAGYADSYEYVRLGWWAKYALQNRLNPFYQSLLGYPAGFFSTTQWMQPLIYWPIGLLSFIVSPAAAFNLWLLIELILSGLAAYWLCLDVTQHVRQRRYPVAALLGGLIFMISPAMQGHLVIGQINPLANYALPIIVLCLYRISVQRGGVRIALVGAVACWVLALGNFTAPVYALLPIVLFGSLYLLICQRNVLRREGVSRDLLILFGVAGLLIVPFYVPLLLETSGPDRPSYLQDAGSVTYSAEPLSFISFSPFTLWGRSLAPDFSRVILDNNNATENAGYLGIAAVMLALIGLWRSRRPTGLWLIILLGCLIFSLGPLLKWVTQPVEYTLGGYRGNIALPWALFQNLPIINITRTPARFNITAGLALGVLAALGFTAVLQRVKPQNWQRRVNMALVIGAFIVFEYQMFFPFPGMKAALPPYFDQLAARQDIRAVLDVPLEDTSAQKLAMYQQTLHHKPLIAGYVSRHTSVDPLKLAMLESAAFGTAAFASRTDQGRAARALLKKQGVDVLIYHWAMLDREATLRWAIPTFGAPVFENTEQTIFEIR